MKNLILLTVFTAGLISGLSAFAQEEHRTVEIKKTITIDGMETSGDTLIFINGEKVSSLPGDMEYNIVRDGETMTVTVDDTGDISVKCDSAKSAHQVFVSMNMREGDEEAVSVTTSEEMPGDNVVVKTIFMTVDDDEKDEIMVFYNDDGELETEIKGSIIILDVMFEDIEHFDLPEGVLENTLDSDLVEFYPNPNKGRFNLRMETGSESDADLKIYDENGREIINKHIEGKSGVIEESLDISEFGVGAYIISIQQDGKILNRKIVVN